MQIEERVFARKVPDFQRLAKYGFQKNEKGQYVFATPFMDKQFQAKVTVDAKGKVRGTAIDNSTDEEYLLLRSASPGPFASEVIAGYQQVLKDIAKHCFLDVPFKSPQANRITKQIEEKFGDRPEHIFQNLPHYAVFREPNSTKWYGLVMDVPENKLAGQKGASSDKVEVIEVKIDPKDRARLLKLPGIYPGYHMNKQNWLCVALDDSLTDDKIMALIRKSHATVLVNNVWLIPANPKYYNIMGAFDDQDEITWKQSTNIQVGDIVFMYVTSPVRAIIYRCKVLATDLPYLGHNKYLTIHRVMKIKFEQRFPADKFTFAFLKKHGVKAVRGPQHVKKDLLKLLK